MNSRFPPARRKLALTFWAALVLAAPAGFGQITVVDIIPQSLSGESNRDSEPNVAVNPANPQEIAASAFTPDPMGGVTGPIFVSTDGGGHWVLNNVLPGGNRSVDITLRFGGTSNVLYSGILRLDNSHLNILRKPNFTAAGLMDILVDRASEDQPYVAAATVLGGSGTGRDRVYIGHNDFNASAGKTATVETSLDAALAVAPAGFFSIRIDPRATGGQDGPSIRPAIHLDGTVYAAYFGWRSSSGSNRIGDVVVARDDSWASGAAPFTALPDPNDSQAGVRVATNVSFPFNSLLGTQRVGSHISIAVDPRNSRTVYLAWADGTSGANYTLHLRSSNDGGANWTPDLRTITTATNPALAVNRDGTVGFLYQQLGNPGSGNRWRTHFERSTNGFSSAPVDLTLADVPDSNGSYTGINPIGDYDHLMAAGRTFYGVFSGNNTPDNANFPNGVTYLRNANFTTHTLLPVSGTAAVAASIDPFFFKVADVTPENDFYVRDWTDNPASGDTGLEPSTHSVFYATSDVWNRRGTLPGNFPNDQPDSENAGNGAGNIGDNWAFARIRRNAPGSGSQNVTAHFLVSKFGTGSNFVDGSVDPDVSFPDPDPTITFNPSDIGPLITAACHWHLNAISSTHLCLAVEITAPNDPFVAPSLLGNAPGWPTTDLRIINDNNKAQRNMGLSTTPARGVGGRDSVYALVHNAATYRRDMVIRYQAAPEVIKRLGEPRIELVGSGGRPMRPDDTFTLSKMQPGENRWIGVTFTAPPGKEGEILPVNFYEVADGVVLNGFTVGPRLASMDQVIRDNLESHRSLLTRLAAGFHLPGAENEPAALRELLKRARFEEKAYAEFLRGYGTALRGALATLIKSQKVPDSFGMDAAAGNLVLEASRGDVARCAVAHAALLNKADSFLTMLELSQGDTADILQNVRWQKDLYTRVPALKNLQCAKTIVESSDKFIALFSARKTDNKSYTDSVRELLGCFQETAKALTAVNCKENIAEIERSLESPRAMQKVHRGFLLKLQTLAR